MCSTTGLEDSCVPYHRTCCCLPPTDVILGPRMVCSALLTAVSLVTVHILLLCFVSYEISGVKLSGKWGTVKVKLSIHRRGGTYTHTHTHTHLYTLTIRRIMNVAWDHNFFLNNQPDALIIQILFCYKILHVSGISSAHHQEFSTVHSALVSFMQVFDDCFQAESGWNTVPSWLCLEAVIKTPHETYQCRMNRGELLLMGRGDARNM